MAHLPLEDEPIVVTESRKVHRITMKRWIAGLLEAFEMDRGAIYTLKRLFTRPGKLFLDYVGISRYHYVPSFRLLAISTAVILLILSSVNGIDNFFEGFQEGAENADPEDVQRFQKLFTDYFNLLLWMYLPFGAFFTWLLTRKHPYNFAEHLVLQTYLLSIANILSVLFLLLLVVESYAVGLIYLASTVFYYTVAYHDVFRKSWIRAFLETTIIMSLSYLAYFIFIVVLILIYFSVGGYEL